MTFYCPKCWQEIQEGDTRCPLCGYDLRAHEMLSYEDKLIAALDHPIRENRQFAIEALGDLRSQRAMPHFARNLREEQDYYLIRETLKAVAKFGTADSRALLRSATEHPSRLVRALAIELTRKEVAR